MADTRGPQPPDHYKGWLFKWTNYIKGYQKRWFVLQNGYLSYYRNQAEMSSACRGTINLANSFIHTQDSCSFVISNSGAMTFHLKAVSEVERQHWVTALELAKSKAITLIESDEDEDLAPLDKTDLETAVTALASKLDDLKTCHDLITKHGAILQRAVGELETSADLAPGSAGGGQEGVNRAQVVNEKAKVFRITSSAMIGACGEYVTLAQTQGNRWRKLLEQERERRLYLEDMVEQLGKQHSNLEKQVRKSLHASSGGGGPGGGLPGGGGGAGFNNGARHGGGSVDPEGGEEDDEDFYDAVDDYVSDQRFDFKTSLSTDLITNKRAIGATQKGPGDQSGDAAGPGSSVDKTLAVASTGGAAASSHKRRKTIPERPNVSLNLWSIMKNCIGKDLSKIPMPVNFSEPLSFLQRLTEEFEYADCLARAAACDDDHEQLAHIAAFTVSAYANTTLRTGKPFNPLLGETFECDRTDDLGWKSFAEQVSHHPPMVAMHTEGRGWVHWQEFTMSSKFRGKYLQIIPLGIAHLLFPRTGNHYTWRKVSTTVHNIIVGRLWVDNHGEMEITNHHTGDQCRLKYYAYSYFSREVPRKVSGVIADSTGVTKYVLSGTWDDKLEGARVLGAAAPDPSKGTVEYETGPSTVLWLRRIRPPELEKCYNFTQLAVELNELEEGVAPTDSRHRPDQRLMEEGRWDDANDTKVLLEEKQRAARRARESVGGGEEPSETGQESHSYTPHWFRMEPDPQTGNLIHVFGGEYWKCKEAQDWSRCPDIYVSLAP